VILPLFTGDFAEAIRRARLVRERTASSMDRTDEELVASALVAAYTESGDYADAARSARDALARNAALPHRVEFIARMKRAVGRGEPAPSTSGDGAIDALYRGISDMPSSDPLDAWRSTYVPGVETRAEALGAVEVLDSLHGDARGVVDDVPQREELGQVLALTGRDDEARPLLQGFARVCTSKLAYPLLYMHAQLYLGELDERASNTESACSHFAQVLARWGHATPRSVTADEARAHARKIGCSPQ
jgi:hypothetical protein